MTSSVHPHLVRAYRETDFVVFSGGGNFSLSVGCVCSELARTMAQFEVTTAAVLTACNPASQPGDPANWEKQQAQLEKDLETIGVNWITGEGRDPSGAWPSEPSLLALGISLPDADRLARRYGQNAFVWVASIIGLPALKLTCPLLVPDPQELSNWRASLPQSLGSRAELLPKREQAALMSVRNGEISHWLQPELWDITQAWPLARPDGSAMGIGTELDRMFKLVDAGICATYADYADSPEAQC